MKNFFNNIFSSKKKKDKKKNKPDQIPQMMQMDDQLQMEMAPPIQFQQKMNQMPMQMKMNSYYQGPSRPKKVFDLKNERIPLRKVEHVKGKVEIRPEEIISLELKTSYKSLSRKDYETEESNIPMLVSIKTEDIESDEFRKGIDLVLVIDVSGSMCGEKIQLVRETLDFVLGELEDRDRCCLVRFNNEAEQITGFRSMTDANKEFMRKLVKDEIVDSGSTDLRKAMEIGFDVMLGREEVNDTTAVFLLSDGDDTCGNNQASIQSAMKAKHAEMEKRNYDYQIHSFGYGSDHDEKVLSMISDFTGGNFYYIKTNKYVDECFIDCFGYLMSVFATNVQVELEMLKGYELKDVFSILWKKTSNKKAVLKLHGLAVGKTLEYITEIGFIKTELGFEPELDTMIARARMTYVYDDLKKSIEKDLSVKLVEKDDQKGDADEDVEEAYAKAEGVRAMERARKLVEEGKQKEAEERLKNYHSKMNNNQYLDNDFKSKIGKTVCIDFVKESKDYMQVNKMMTENAYNPAYESFQVKNKKQARLFSKKKGF